MANRVKDVRLQKDIERKELAIEHYNFGDLINMDENGKYTLMVDHRE